MNALKMSTNKKNKMLKPIIMMDTKIAHEVRDIAKDQP